MFYLVHELFFERHPYYAFEKAANIRSGLLTETRSVDAGTFGAASQAGDAVRREIRQVVKSGSLSPRYGHLLFRLINYLRLQNILELGTGVGAGTIYLALTSSKSKVWTIEGNADKAGVARDLFDRHHIGNVKTIQGRFSEVLPGVLSEIPSLDFVFFDGDHRREPTLEYFNACMAKAHDNTLFVFDDIHWSKGMESAWTEIIGHPAVTVSVDLFRLGLVFFQKGCQKQHYTVLY
jgi:predicted O-methyltransferase YrrM